MGSKIFKNKVNLANSSLEVPIAINSVFKGNIVKNKKKPENMTDFKYLEYLKNFNISVILKILILFLSVLRSGVIVLFYDTSSINNLLEYLGDYTIIFNYRWHMNLIIVGNDIFVITFYLIQFVEEYEEISDDLFRFILKKDTIYGSSDMINDIRNHLVKIGTHIQHFIVGLTIIMIIIVTVFFWINTQNYVTAITGTLIIFTFTFAEFYILFSTLILNLLFIYSYVYVYFEILNSKIHKISAIFKAGDLNEATENKLLALKYSFEEITMDINGFKTTYFHSFIGLFSFWYYILQLSLFGLLLKENIYDVIFKYMGFSFYIFYFILFKILIRHIAKLNRIFNFSNSIVSKGISQVKMNNETREMLKGFQVFLNTKCNGITINDNFITSDYLKVFILISINQFIGYFIRKANNIELITSNHNVPNETIICTCFKQG